MIKFILIICNKVKIKPSLCGFKDFEFELVYKKKKIKKQWITNQLINKRNY